MPPLIKSKIVKTGKKPFDPEGTGYDYQGALKAGLDANKKGKWGSLVPESGLVLKGRKHKTWNLTVQEETKLGRNIMKIGPRYYSIK